MAHSVIGRGLFDKVPIYRGLPSESLLDFFEKFRSLTIYEGWDNDTKCQKIVAFLSGRALHAAATWDLSTGLATSQAHTGHSVPQYQS